MLPLALLLLGSLLLAFALPGGPNDDEHEPQETIQGDDGDNTIAGTDGFDIMFGNDGNDVLSGGGGNDSIEGGFGVDTLSGEAGDDSLYGGGLPSILYGGEGNDLLIAPQGFGLLSGEAGDDRLISEGANQLSGGAGNDVFQLEVREDEDQPPPTFVDFTPGEDKVEIYYTPVAGVSPEVLLNPDPSVNGQNSYLEFNGIVIAYVLGEFGLNPEDIILIPIEPAA